MRVVLDTNVLVSAAMTAQGTCAQIVDLLTEGVFTICVNDMIVTEYDDVLRRPELRIVSENADAILDLIRCVAEPITAIPLPADLPDNDDRPFLEVAATAGAILVTGNMRHYPEDACSGVTVVTPAEFLEVLRRSP